MKFSLHDENKIICVVFTCPALSGADAVCSEGVSDITTNWRRIRAIKNHNDAYYSCRTHLAKGEAQKFALRLKYVKL